MRRRIFLVLDASSLLHLRFLGGSLQMLPRRGRCCCCCRRTMYVKSVRQEGLGECASKTKTVPGITWKQMCLNLSMRSLTHARSALLTAPTHATHPHTHAITHNTHTHTPPHTTRHDSAQLWRVEDTGQGAAADAHPVGRCPRGALGPSLQVPHLRINHSPLTTRAWYAPKRARVRATNGVPWVQGVA
jgi:hypothetical protein